VGDPVARFAEDGLRIMRAIRFAATLGFALDAETEAAIPSGLPSLAKVSRERVKIELDKLLAAPDPGFALMIARRTGVLEQDIAEAVAGVATEADWKLRCQWIDAAQHREVRLAALLSGLSDGAWAQGSDPLALARGDANAAARADVALRRLKATNEERDRVARLVRVAWAGRAALGETTVRRLLALIGRARGQDAVELWNARAAAEGNDAAGAVADVAHQILDRGDPLAVGDLAVSGAVLMQQLNIAPGREVGRLLELAMDAVLDDPNRNQHDELLAIVRRARANP
jgi:tRNA nucleotidyltransferase (CCA-adding enzyme)